ncbi:hypothetical protein FRC09_013871, partial [Ceratobasidium sp. 395]
MQAQLEKKNMLPKRLIPVNQFFAFPDIQELQGLSQHHPGMLQLINAKQNYDIVTPIAPPCGVMDVIRERIPILQIQEPPTPSSLFQYLQVGYVPHHFINEANKDVREHVDFSRLIQSGFFVHKPTRTVFGGLWGVKWAVLVVLWLEITWQQINIGKILYPSSITLPEIGRWRASIDSNITYLSNLVEDSHEHVDHLRSSKPGACSTILIVQLTVPAPTFQPLAIVAQSPFAWDKPWLYGMRIPKMDIKTGFPKSTRMSVVVPMMSTQAKKFGVLYPTMPKKGKGLSRTPAPSSGSLSPVAGLSNVGKPAEPALQESSLESKDDFIPLKPTSPCSSACAPSDVEMQTGDGEKTSKWEDMDMDPVRRPEKEHELLNSRFPKLPLWDKGNIFVPFPDKILEECEGLVHMVPNLPLATGMANKYQTCGPPGVALGMFKDPTFATTFMNLPTIPLTPKTFPAWLAEPSTNQFYYAEADNHNTWGPLPLSKLVPIGVGIMLKCGRCEKQYAGMKKDYSNSHPSMVQSYFCNAATNVQTWISELLQQISSSADEHEISKVKMAVFGEVLSLKDTITAGSLTCASSAAILCSDNDSDFIIEEPEEPKPEEPKSGAPVNLVAPLVSVPGTVKLLHQLAASGQAHCPRNLLQVQAKSMPH